MKQTIKHQPRGKDGKLVSQIECGRRFCSQCGKWRLLLDYSPKRWWDEEQTIIRHVSSVCQTCERVRGRKDYAKLSAARKKRKSAASRAWHRRDRRRKGIPEAGARVVGTRHHGSVRREPFGRWLREQIIAYGMAYVIERTKLQDRRIRSIINGYETSGGHNIASRNKGGTKRKLRQIDWISFEMVDQALLNWGDMTLLNELYPIDKQPDLTPPVSLLPEHEKTPELEQLEAEAELIGKDKVPDVIGAYEARRRARRAARRQARSSAA